VAGDGTTLLLMDANVLIDFLDSDDSIFGLASEHIGRVHVPTLILEEELTHQGDRDWAALGIHAVEPSLDVLARAARPTVGLSFQDKLCLLLAKERGWTCVTNDKRLRRECKGAFVSVMWGLELVAILVERDALPALDAERVARAIQVANTFITPALLARFLKRVRGHQS